MSRFVDTSICPDCRAPLDHDARCTGCGLRLWGPLAVRLWETMVDADRLVEQLRTVVVPAPPAISTASAESPTSGLPPAPPSVPAVPPRTPRRRVLPPMSVPVVLLALGALCLLVAATVFVVVTWGSLGLLGRTLVLLGVTGVVAGAARWVTRRELRGAAESLWLVVAGMLALDLWAAHTAGLAGLDAVSGRHSVTLTGLALAGLGAGVARWTERQPITALWGMQVVAALGTLAATVSAAWLADDPATGTVLAVPLLVAGVYAARSLPGLAAFVGGVAGMTWLALVFLGVMRVVEPLSWSAWWSQLRGWPLLVAAAYAGSGALVRRFPLVGRQVLAGAGLLLVSLSAVAPIDVVDTDRQSLVRSVVIVALVVVVVVVRDLAWVVPAALLAAGGTVVTVLAVLASPWGSLARLPLQGSAGLRTPGIPGEVDAWAFLVAAASAALALHVLPRRVRVGVPRGRATAEAGSLAGAVVLAAGVGTAVIGLGMPLALSAGSMTVLSIAIGVLTWRLRVVGPVSVATSVAGGSGTAYLGLLALTAGAPSSALTGGIATALVIALGAWYVDAERRGPLVAPAVLAGVTVGLGGVATYAWMSAAGSPNRWVSWSVVLVAGAVALTAHLAARRPTSRLVLEVSALVVGVVGAAVASSRSDLAGGLTIVTAVATALAVRHHDRAVAPWVGLVNIAFATALRVDAHLPRPELYVVPPALALLVAGILRGRGRAGAVVSTSSTDGQRVDLLVGAGLAHAALLLLATLRLDLGATVVATGGALVLTVVAACLDRAGSERTGPPAVLLAVLFTGVSVAGWLRYADVEPRALRLALAGLASMVLLGAAAATRLSWSRLAAEAGAALIGLAAVALSPDLGTAAHVLVVLGTATAVVTVTLRDRGGLGWVVVPLLGTAEFVLGVRSSAVVEGWVLAGLGLLLLGGLARARRDRVTPSTSPLLAGLALGFVASMGVATSTDVDKLAAATAVLVLAAAVATWVFTQRLAVWAGLEAATAAFLVAVTGVTAVWTCTHALSASATTSATSYAVLAGALLVGAGPGSRHAASRLVLESSGGVVALASLVVAPAGPAQAMVLTFVGSAVAIVSVLHPDRVHLGWLSTVLLGGATYLRVVDHVDAPELYTLPAATLLLAAGAWRLHTDEEIGSFGALSSGLTLALVPSLLLALDEPDSLRGALMAIGATVPLACGVRLRLAAPFAAGAACLALLAVRHLAPMGDAVPRWVSLAALGMGLLVVGITWEQRLRDLRVAQAYVAALR